MIKFDVFNRFSGAVQFTAEIDANDGDGRSFKLGLAVKWAMKNGANLDGANLYGANLDGANLARANLVRANLYGANLDGANLARANLVGASLVGASLVGANLVRANLYGANLYGANLVRANLDGASLVGANLVRANLYGANLYGANLVRANLDGASLVRVSGLNDYVKCVQIDQYPITYTSDVLQIGCQRHAIHEWREFDDKRILEMDGKGALKFWRKYKAWIFQTIELCPAEPTSAEAES